MKKFFTLIFALLGLSAAVSAATVDDLKVCQHSYVLKMQDVLEKNGGVKPGKGQLFGDGFFLDVTGGSVNTKGSWDLSSETAIALLGEKYVEYGNNAKTWRLKNGQDQIAMKITAGSKLIILGEKHASRYPTIALTQAANDGKNQPIEGAVGKLNVNTVSENGYFEWTALDDNTIYIGSFGGDYYISYVIVEANEAPGTPSVKVGEQAYDGGEGMWFREVTCKPSLAEGEPTICTYTTDGTAPTAESPVYTDPIRIYENCVVKFQAFMDFGDGVAYEEALMPAADNEVAVTFSFEAPIVTVDGANVSIEGSADGAVNYYSIDGGEWTEGDTFTLTESATVSFKSEYENPDVTVFTSNVLTKDIYVLTPISETTVVTVSGKAVVDAEATAADPNGNTIYKVEDGAISADKAHFFVKNLVLAAVPEAEYQIDGQEAYIQMSNTTIDFELAEASAITVVCSKNSAKNLDTDKQCKITVDGGTYGGEDVTGTYELADAEGNIIETLPGNVVKFDLEAGHHQFKKYSGTGAIKIASITIEPGKSVFVKSEGEETGINNVNVASAAKTAKALVNGQLVIKSARGTFTAAGAQVK